ncbi:hypothetical protein [Nocardia altamirensis]|uniref:hypothetical protein n=1 Tax=Nocardia altamirensis TaxID=472158 RepID=UPI00083FEAF9|nr:hypothetical protein [Nocardia altamirensis]
MGFNWWREAEADDTSVQAIVDRIQEEWRAERRRQQVRAELSDAVAPHTVWPHEAPDRPLGISEAHAAMQLHKECRADQCPYKAAARQTLIDAGRMKPDVSRNS